MIVLILRDLHKYYRTGKGGNLHALRGINLKFGSRGFVFILGKSGSGKSTLLNVLGGLDKFDSGDIIIKNKSSRDFADKDWDSYRNTYLGFVFQEFHIIESYSIAKNIGLALELQGMTKHEIAHRVSDILAKVDLKEYGRRKPSQLSGGQKQRIAIARALVKNPEIILADEPTGNLDSETGTQVLEILRKLAEEKLVIMVSHDKDNAYKYADRIITLQDGTVVSDEYNEGGLKYISNEVDLYRTDGEITKVIRIPRGKSIDSGQLAEINDSMAKDNAKIYIPVAKGQALTAETLEMVNRIVSMNNEDTYIPIAREVPTIQGTKEENYKDRVNPAKESIDESDSKPFRLIKSRLPLGNSVKMALSSIWRKKYKMVFTIILFLVAIGMFGFSETITKFDFAESMAASYADGNIDIISLKNTKMVIDWGDEKSASVPFDLGEIEGFMSQYKRMTYGITHNFTSEVVRLSTEQDLVTPTSLSGFLALNSPDELGLKILAGRFPKNSSEIMFTDFAADYIARDENLPDASALVGTKYKVGRKNYTISGVVDTDYENYLYLNDLPKSQYKEMTSLIGEYSNKHDSIYSRIIVNPDFYGEYVEEVDSFSGVYDIQINKEDAENEWETDWAADSVFKFNESMLTDNRRNQYLYVSRNFNGLGENEILVSPLTLARVFHLENDQEIRDLIYYDVKRDSRRIYDELVSRGFLNKEIDIHFMDNNDYIRVETKRVKIVGVLDFDMYRQYAFMNRMYNELIKSGYQFTSNDFRQFEEDTGYYHYRVTTAYMRHILIANGITAKTEEQYHRDSRNGDYMRYLEILMNQSGLKEPFSYENMGNPIVLNEAEFDKLNPFNANKAQNIIIKISDDIDYNTTLFKQGRELGYRHNTLTGKVLDLFGDFRDEAAHIFRYLSLALAVFAALLMFMNISSSVLAAKKEIGTLRAIGARGNDVAIIFVTESVIIAIVTCILAVVGVHIVTALVNSDLSKQMGMNLAIFNLSPLVTGEMILLAMGVVLVSSYVPVKGVSIMNPIDAINK